MQMASGGGIPSIFNHLDGGSFTVAASGDFDIQTNINFPKGIIVWSNDFPCYNPKTDKAVLGSYAAIFIAPSDIDQAGETNQWTIISSNAFYFTNWGQNTDQSNANPRASRVETRGLCYFKKSTKQFRLRGFGTGDYDFKLNTQYNWIAWD